MTIEQSWASHNTAATTWLCFQTQTLLIIALYSLWLLYKKDIESFTFFVFFLITDDPLRWRLVVVAKLKNCRVPSSAIDWLDELYTGGGGGCTLTTQLAGYPPLPPGALNCTNLIIMIRNLVWINYNRFCQRLAYS